MNLLIQQKKSVLVRKEMTVNLVYSTVIDNFVSKMILYAVVL